VITLIDVSSAHLHLHGPELAVCHRRLACHMGSHSITCHPIHITAVIFPALKPVPICTAWWTWHCTKLELNERSQGCKFGTLSLHY